MARELLTAPGAVAPAICEPATMLDFLRGIFVYVVAVALPLAGAIIAIVRLADGERDEAIRIGAAALLGACVYALVLS
jgi:hypothetical protein